MTWSGSWKKNKLAANVSTLKVHLGRYLKKIRAGEEVIVLDRQNPVAKLIPFTGEQERLEEIPPTLSWQDIVKSLAKADLKKQPTPLKRGSIAYLNQDREGR